MLKRLGLSSPASLGMLNFTNTAEHDKVKADSKYGNVIYDRDPNETGKDRLYMMYSTE